MQPESERPSSIVLRRARPEEAGVVAAITDAAYALYVPRLGGKPQPMTADYTEKIANHSVWLLLAGETPAGALTLEYEPDQLFIYSVAVHPDQQKKEYGRTLLAFAEQDARDHGYRGIRLFTNAIKVENIALYLRLGYIETGREEYRGTTLVHMAKTLD